MENILIQESIHNDFKMQIGWEEKGRMKCDDDDDFLLASETIMRMR